MPQGLAFWRLCAAVALNLLITGNCMAGALRYCNPSATLTASQQDKILQFAAQVKAELESSGNRLAIVSRSGLDLSYFGQRYSHAGISLQGNPSMPWSVRQLYFDCAEQKPQLFDQGMAGFVMGTDDPDKGFVSLLLMPEAQAGALERSAKDNAISLQLLAAQYSANAFAFSTQYQNCNQWLAEMLAVAWAKLPLGDSIRDRAQAWLQAQNYAPTAFNLRWRPLLWTTAFSNLVHTDDHPAADLDALMLQVSMPASLETFIRVQAPETRRIELCRTATQIVVRRGWEPLSNDCVAADGDQVIALE